MKELGPAAMLWRNVLALMQHQWGKANQSRLAREAKIGKATTDALKKGAREIKTETIERIAKVFRVPAWQLLYPALDPAHPPQLIPISDRAIEVAKTIDAITDVEERAELCELMLRLAKLGSRRRGE